MRTENANRAMGCNVGVSMAALVCVGLAMSSDTQTSNTKLLLAFASYRDRPMHAKTFFYEHDGVSEGKIIGSIEPVNLRQDTHPSLTADGKLCAFNLELENNAGRIGLWDMTTKKLIDLPNLNDSPNALMGASICNDGHYLAYSAWRKPGASQRWDIFLYDLVAKKPVDLPGLNTQEHDERMPAISGDGRFIAFASNRPGGAGLTDIYLYDRNDDRVVAIPEMNSPRMDLDPSLSADGRLIAFSSDRSGGMGGRDLYLFDRIDKKFLPLPGLNSVGHEQSPSLSSDGRFIVFVSERIGGAGERDIYLYDREAQKLLPTPGLNAKQEDFDPCVVVFK